MLISNQEAADLLGVSATDTLLVRLVAAADDWAMRACDRTFERQVRTEYVKSYCRDFVLLRESPIIAVTAVTIDETGSFASTSSRAVDVTRLVFNSDVFEDDPKLYWTLGTFPNGPRSVRVTYEAGWWPAQNSASFNQGSLNITLLAANLPVAPQDIRAALLDLVCANYKRGADERMHSERQGDRSWTRFADGIDPQITEVVNRYRRFRF